MNGILIAMECSIIRWLYVKVWKNVGMLNDDFVCSFLVSFNIFLSIFLEMVVIFSADFTFEPLVSQVFRIEFHAQYADELSFRFRFAPAWTKPL